MTADATASIETNTVLTTLRAQIGADDFDGAVHLFISEAQALFHSIEERAAVHDHDGLRRIAHRLTGVLLQYGFARAAAAASDLEKLPGAPADHTHDLAELRGKVDAAIALMRRTAECRPDVRQRTYSASSFSSHSTKMNNRASITLSAATETFLETKRT